MNYWLALTGACGWSLALLSCVQKNVYRRQLHEWRAKAIHSAEEANLLRGRMLRIDTERERLLTEAARREVSLDLLRRRVAAHGNN